MSLVRAITCKSLRFRPGPAVQLAATTASWAGAALLVAGLFVRAAAGAGGQLFLFGGALLAFACLMLARARALKGRVVERAEDAIRIRPGAGRGWRPRRSSVVTCKQVEDAYLVSPSRLVLQLRGGVRVELDLESDDAHDLARHLGATVEQRALRTPLETMSWNEILLLEPLLVTWIVGVVVGGWGLWVAFVLSIAYAIALDRSSRGLWLLSGLDGISIVGGRRPRFIAYDTISRMSRSGRRLVLETSSGTVRLPRIDDREILRALAARINEGRAAAHTANAPTLDALAKGERSVVRWRNALDDLTSASFREPAISEDDLDGVLSDVGAPLEHRVGAALVLRGRCADAQPRIELAAATSAELRVRIALEVAAEDEIDDRELERALGDELQQDFAKGRRTQ